MDKSETLRRQGLFQHVHTVRERPLLFITLTVSLFVVMAAGATAFSGTEKSTGSIQLMVRADPIDIDRSSETPAALIKPRPFDPKSLLNFVLADTPLGTTAEQEATGSAEGSIDVALEQGDDGSFVITLDGMNEPEHVVDSINDRITTFVERLNLERAMQRELASSWIDRFGSQWRARLEDAKSAITTSPFDAGATSEQDPFKTERLLRFMIDATAAAQTSLEVEGHGNNVVPEQSAEVANLASDVTRLTSAMADLERRHAAQFKQVQELKTAEESLARHLKEADIIQAPDSLLNRPAALILSPAVAMTEDDALGNGKTSLIWLAMLALSLLMAALGTMIFGRYQHAAASGNNEMLNNPNWPLPPGADRELSH